MKIAPFLLCAQISCALVAALDGILSEGVKVSELFDRSQLAAENGYQVGHGQKGLPKRLWRREDQQSQVEKRSVETEHDDALTEEAKDKWTSFSEGLNTRERWVEVEKRSGGVFKRSDASGKVSVGGYEVEKVHIFAFIEGDQYNKGQCGQKLKSYCDGLEKNNEIMNGMHPLVKSICKEKNEQDKCNKLKQNVTSKCDALKNALTQLENQQKLQTPSKLTDEDCAKNEPECSFLDGTDDELKGKCNGLRDACYKMKRDKVAEEVLMRVLSGSLKEKQNECETPLKEQCPLLGLQSDELFQKCLDPDGTCKDLQKKAKAKCTALKKSVETALGKKGDDTFKDKCHSLLEECHFYSSNCEDKDKPECEQLKKDCEDKGFTYTPPGFTVDPIEQAPGFFEKIDLEALYKKSALEGVFIGRLRELSRENFLALITPPKQNQQDYQNECKKELGNKCKNHKSFPSEIKGLCKGENEASSDGDTTCGTLQNNIKIKCGSLKSRLKGDGVLNNDKNKIYTWKELETISYFTERDCEYLESQCLYLEKHCESHDLGKGCHNLRSVCYKRALNDLAYVPLEVALRGELSSINKRGSSTSDQKKKLLVSCQELRNQSIELFQLCIDPENTLNSLEIDIHEKARILKPALDHRRDFPEERDCVELKNQCEHLEADSNLVEEACHTLKTRCQFRRLSEGLKLRLLEERKEMFKNNTTCINVLNEKCDLWHKKKDKKYAFPCALPEDSCKLMMWRVGEHCGALDANLENQNVKDKIEKDAKGDELTQEKICLEWIQHCNKLVPNCKDLAKDDNAPCKKLNKTCGPIIGRWNNEGWLMYQLRGNLTNNKCKNNLDDLCSGWGKEKNATLDSFCKDKSSSKDNHNDYRTNLCKKLEKRIKEKCPVLEKKLKEAENEVTKKAKEYENQRKKAKDAIEKANLSLSKELKEKIEKASLVRRDNKNSTTAAGSTQLSPKEPIIVEISPVAMEKKHLEAIELIFQVLNFYVELTDQCEELKVDCGFQEDCKDCKASCNKIIEECKEVVPLTLMRPSAMRGECKIENGTKQEGKASSEGKQEGKPSEPKPAPGGAGEGKNCTSIKTSDTWVTSTSTKTTTITSTSTKTLKVTLTSTRKCKPTKCTTGKPESTKGGDEEEVVPSGGKRWLPSVGIVIVGVVVAVM